MADYYDDDERELMNEGGPPQRVRYARPDNVGADFVPYPIPGTINRPMLVRPDDAQPRQYAGINTVRWGDSRRLIVLAGTGTATTEFMRVDLPAARVCSISLHASHVFRDNPANLVFSTVFEVFLGVGSAQIIRRVGFSSAPFPGAPVDFVLADVPLNSIHIRASVIANPVTEILVAAQLSPIQSVS